MSLWSTHAKFQPGVNFFPEGIFGDVWRQFWFSQPGSCYWHLVHQGQQYCWTFHNVQDSPLQKSIHSAQNVSSAEVEKTLHYCFRSSEYIVFDSCGVLWLLKEHYCSCLKVRLSCETREIQRGKEKELTLVHTIIC